MNPLSQAFAVLEQIEATSGTKLKQQIVHKAISDDQKVYAILKEYFRLALDPFITFGVVLPATKGGQSVVEGNPDFEDGMAFWDDVTAQLDALAKREVTGNEARDELNLLMEASTPLQHKWLTRMVNKNPLIGLAEKGVLKLWPGLFEVFTCQLAEEWDGVTVPKNAAVEPKYDGLRALFFIDGKQSCVLSRNGKPLNNVSHILEELLIVFGSGVVVDGELFAEDWSKSVSAARSEENGDTSSRFKVFDVIPLDLFKSKGTTDPLSLRRLDLLCLRGGCRYSIFEPGIPVSTKEDVMKATEVFIGGGYEGGVLKDLDAPYEFKRSSSWSKIKLFKSADLPITGFKEGAGGSKYEGSLGAIVVKGGVIEETEVGSGFSDDLRKEIWSNRYKYLGRTVEVKYQELTADRLMRFPIFLRLRDDK